MSDEQNNICLNVQQKSWEYLSADTQYLTHDIHRYSGKFIPQIASRAISLLTKPNDLVVDPYCGSGTTLVESALLHRRSIGFDLNPLAILIARTKLKPVAENALEKLTHFISETLVAYMQFEEHALFNRDVETLMASLNKDQRLTHAWYRKWFQLHVLRDLLAIDHTISTLNESSLRNIALVALSNILRRFSNAHTGYPNVMFDKNAPQKASPIIPYIKSLERCVSMVKSLSSVDANWSNANVLQGDATKIPLVDEVVDAVITHPPYVASVPYAEYGYLSLKWLKEDTVKLNRELTGGQRQSKYVVERFEAGFGKMLAETARILKKDGYVFLMVGNPIVRGKVIDLREMTIRLSFNAGLNLFVQTKRKGVNRRANKMGEEFLLFFNKS